MVPLGWDVWVGQTLAGCRDSAGCGRQELGFCGGRQAQAQPHLERTLEVPPQRCLIPEHQEKVTWEPLTKSDAQLPKWLSWKSSLQDRDLEQWVKTSASVLVFLLWALFVKQHDCVEETHGSILH